MNRNNYIIGIDIEFPKSKEMKIDELNRILSNKSLNTNFYSEFKEELQKYEFGMFVIGYLIGDEGQI